MVMYDNSGRIQKELDSFKLGFCGKLDPDNRWIKKAALIPWELLEPHYKHHFNNKGRPAKRFRVALGTLIIQETKKMTDRETVQEIAENPYMQFFLGFPAFEAKIPFDASLLVYFRKRLNWKGVSEINDRVIGLSGKEEPGKTSDDNDDDSGKLADNTNGKINNKGTMIIDATVTPADIRHPQDLSLLDEARRDTEKIIDILHETVGGKTPRTYRKKARSQFLETIRKRRKEPKQIHKAIGQQLRFVGRNLRSIDSLVQRGQTIAKQRSGGLVALSKAQYKNLVVIHELYRQQLEMYRKHSHKTDDRIVSIRQPHVRPIVRGKARSDTEFGAKISMAVINGFVVVDKISFDAYSESNDVVLQAEEYKRRTGYYPERILGDKAYQNRANRQWCADRKIRLMGQKLGRPFELPQINELYKIVERMEEIERVEVEGRIGIQKRRYGWDCVKGRLPETTKTMILIAVLVGNLAQIMRGILLALIRSIIGQRITMKNSCGFVCRPMNFEFEAF